jgi:hypothetical protein
MQFSRADELAREGRKLTRLEEEEKASRLFNVDLPPRPRHHLEMVDELTTD